MSALQAQWDAQANLLSRSHSQSRLPPRPAPQPLPPRPPPKKRASANEHEFDDEHECELHEAAPGFGYVPSLRTDWVSKTGLVPPRVHLFCEQVPLREVQARRRAALQNFVGAVADITRFQLDAKREVAHLARKMDQLAELMESKAIEHHKNELEMFRFEEDIADLALLAQKQSSDADGARSMVANVHVPHEPHNLTKQQNSELHRILVSQYAGLIASGAGDGATIMRRQWDLALNKVRFHVARLLMGTEHAFSTEDMVAIQARSGYTLPNGWDKVSLIIKDTVTAGVRAVRGVVRSIVDRATKAFWAAWEAVKSAKAYIQNLISQVSYTGILLFAAIMLGFAGLSAPAATLSAALVAIESVRANLAYLQLVAGIVGGMCGFLSLKGKGLAFLVWFGQDMLAAQFKYVLRSSFTARVSANFAAITGTTSGGTAPGGTAPAGTPGESNGTIMLLFQALWNLLFSRPNEWLASIRATLANVTKSTIDAIGDASERVQKVVEAFVVMQAGFLSLVWNVFRYAGSWLVQQACRPLVALSRGINRLAERAVTWTSILETVNAGWPGLVDRARSVTKQVQDALDRTKLVSTVLESVEWPGLTDAFWSVLTILMDKFDEASNGPAAENKAENKSEEKKGEGEQDQSGFIERTTTRFILVGHNSLDPRQTELAQEEERQRLRDSKKALLLKIKHHSPNGGGASPSRAQKAGNDKAIQKLREQLELDKVKTELLEAEMAANEEDARTRAEITTAVIASVGSYAANGGSDEPTVLGSLFTTLSVLVSGLSRIMDAPVSSIYAGTISDLGSFPVVLPHDLTGEEKRRLEKIDEPRYNDPLTKFDRGGSKLERHRRAVAAIHSPALRTLGFDHTGLFDQLVP